MLGVVEAMFDTTRDCLGEFSEDDYPHCKV